MLRSRASPLFISIVNSLFDRSFQFPFQSSNQRISTAAFVFLITLRKKLSFYPELCSLWFSRDVFRFMIILNRHRSTLNEVFRFSIIYSWKFLMVRVCSVQTERILLWNLAVENNNDKGSMTIAGAIYRQKNTVCPFSKRDNSSSFYFLLFLSVRNEIYVFSFRFRNGQLTISVILVAQLVVWFRWSCHWRARGQIRVHVVRPTLPVDLSFPRFSFIVIQIPRFVGPFQCKIQRSLSSLSFANERVGLIVLKGYCANLRLPLDPFHDHADSMLTCSLLLGYGVFKVSSRLGIVDNAIQNIRVESFRDELENDNLSID